MSKLSSETLQEYAARLGIRLFTPEVAPEPIEAPGVKHGTVWAYKKHGCRCDPCKEAASVVRRAERERRAERQIEELRTW